jgi:cob(I)alamin adenosyltransferase
MKIYTKTGDTGQTSLFGGTRVPKSHQRLEAYGSLDELNSHLGLLRDICGLSDAQEDLKVIQNRLFDLGSQLANEKPERKSRVPAIKNLHIAALETAIDRMDAQLEPMRYFILPGGHHASSQAHIARTVCRRCERLIVALSEDIEVEPLSIQFLNRLSDYLFVLSRYIIKKNGAAEISWIPDLE